MNVFDITGRVIHTYSVMSPTGTIMWDARTATGAPIASGTYFVRLEVGKKVETRRVVLLR